ncbi:hypothetical protein [Acididesulfobacillus acetoxydans]|uniref:hypothetical protein n=1 Tax=Acididesulfobacillus acetoxydans TaxID=1561005 RepID=UPI001F0FC5DC|nr:hypothetical protein [Acididesulfobacillus acetoxydans]
MTPIEMLISMDYEELIHGLSTLEPDEQRGFMREFDKELVGILERYQEIKVSHLLQGLKKAYADVS